mgnify:FL=1
MRNQYLYLGHPTLYSPRVVDSYIIRNIMENLNSVSECFTVEIAGFGKFGEGFALYREKPVFVLGAIPGEVLTVQPLITKRKYMIAQIVEIIKASSERIVAPCPHFGPCSGCQWQHISYDYQLKLKRDLVLEACNDSATIKDNIVSPTIPSPRTFAYRNHARFTVRNKGMIGFTNRDTKRFIPIDKCMLMDNWINETLANLQSHCAETSQISLRHGTNTESYLIQPKLVTNQINVRTGDKWYEEKILGHLFRISSPSFFQVNTEQLSTIATLISEEMCFTGGEIIVDAYSGVGTFSVLLAGSVQKVIAIEESTAAIDDALENIKGFPNIQLRKGKTEHILKQITEPIHTVILDPSRVGCEESVLKTLAIMAPKNIIYVSCDPDSFARDLKVLEEGSFAIRKIQPVDMFPQTRHIELLAFLSYTGESV